MSETGDGELLLDLRGVSKTFPGQVALDKANLTVQRSEIHALVGQNGCGKSTLIKILSGFHSPDDYKVATIDGESFDLGSATEASGRGIRFIHQTLGLVESMNAVENCALSRGFPTGKLWHINWATERRRVGSLLAKFGVEIDPRTPVSKLSPAHRTMLAIVRALQDWEADVKVLVLDEPTASLPGDDVSRLFRLIRKVASHGIGVVFVSHRMDEVFEIADRVTVMRDGRDVTTVAVKDIDHDGIVQAMIGRSLDSWYGTSEVESGNPVLEVSALAGLELRSLDFTLCQGEILGFAGLIGSGREEISSLIYGARPPTAGSVRLRGEEIAGHGPRGSLDRGICMAPANRLRDGLIAGFPVRVNLTLPSLTPLMDKGFLSRRREREQAQLWQKSLDIRPARIDAEAYKLSGGNQQKLVLAKLLRLSPSVLLLDEPTQGVDIAAKAAIYKILTDRARDDGLSVIICSSDAEELAHVCDRVIVIAHGESVAELSGDGLTHERIESAMLTRKKELTL